MSLVRCMSLETPVGPLTLRECEGAIFEVTWEKATSGPSTPLLDEAARQLHDYFAHARRVFDLPLSPRGTTFQRVVWAELQRIPYGEVTSYGEIAAALNTAPRAVGGACGRNPIPVFIPCHRVVGVRGALTGYSGGKGLTTKSILLNHEISNCVPTSSEAAPTLMP